jgi:hypothetical protein
VRGRETAIGIGWLALAAAFRLPAMGSQLWLDEVWTLRVLEDLRGPLAVLVDFKHSNNHPLLSIWMQALGPQRGPALYRIPSFLAGLAVVWFAWRLGARGGRREASAAAGLAVLSSLLVHYASEARGYELAIAAGLASFLGVARFLDGRRAAGALTIAAGACVGLLSQLLYLEALAGAAAWLALALSRRHRDVRRVLAEGVVALGPAALVAAAILFVVYRGMELGGGEAYLLLAVLLRALSHAAGGPSEGLLALLFAAGFSAATIAGLRAIAAAGRDEWAGYLVAAVVSPALLLVVSRPETLPVRWFVLPVAFATLAAAAWLAPALHAPDRRRRAIALAAVAAFVAGNAYRLAVLARDGRGDYRAAVRYLAEHDASAQIEIGSDHDFRNRILLRYYGAELPEGRTLVYVPKIAKLRSWPTWVLGHRYGAQPDAPAELHAPDGRRYERVAAWPSSDLSGFRWTLYRRAGSAP